MVCKLWYISIRCIFKNLVLKLRIYNFRGVYVCNCPPHLPSSSPKHFPSFPLFLSLFHYSCIFQSVCDCVCCLLFASILIVVDHLLYLFFILYTLPFFFTGVIYLLFLKMALWCCNAPCTTHF